MDGTFLAHTGWLMQPCVNRGPGAADSRCPAAGAQKENAMFSQRSSALDSRLSNIAGHLRAIQRELAELGDGAGQRAAAGATSVGTQLADLIGPIVNDIAERFRNLSLDGAADVGSRALNSGRKIGSDAVSLIATETRHRPLFVILVAIGVGVLIGMAGHRR